MCIGRLIIQSSLSFVTRIVPITRLLPIDQLFTNDNEIKIIIPVSIIYIRRFVNSCPTF